MNFLFLFPAPVVTIPKNRVERVKTFPVTGTRTGRPKTGAKRRTGRVTFRVGRLPAKVHNIRRFSFARYSPDVQYYITCGRRTFTGRSARGACTGPFPTRYIKRDPGPNDITRIPTCSGRACARWPARGYVLRSFVEYPCPRTDRGDHYSIKPTFG